MNRYIAYLKKVNQQIREIAEREDTSLPWLYLDYSYCLVRHGCLVNQYNKGHFYKHSETVRAKSFTQRRLTRVINRYNNHHYIHLLENKNEFNTFFKDFINRSWLYSKDMTKDEFVEFIGKCDKVFIKPLDDMEGHGISLLSASDADIDSLYEDLRNRNLILEEGVEQHPALDLGNKSVNTARILTVTDSSGIAHVISAGLRAGVGDAVIDNFSAGGVLYEIDIRTGKIDHKGIQGDNYDVIFHPATDVCMLGFQIPHWDKAVAGVKAAAQKLPQCRFIGWDVAFTKDGIELIEGNHNPGIFTMESLGTTGVYAKAMSLLAGSNSSILSRVNRYRRDIKKYRRGIDKGKKPGLLDCIWSLIRYGCVLNHYLYGKFYLLSSKERRDAFTYRHWQRIVPGANDPDKIHLLKNKVDFNTYFADFLHREWLFSATMSFEDFSEFIRRHKEVIVKPVDGLEGNGIYLKKFQEHDDPESAFSELRSGKYLIEEKIIQHPDMVFGNKSVNTIRAYTIYNEKTDRIEILKTVVRAGVGDSIVDNSHSGGCAYEVDRESGKIISPSYCADGTSSEIHPLTDIHMIGRTIPFWNEVRRICMDAAAKIKECKFIGWDVAISESGPLLIEGNHTPDLDMVEFVGSHGYLPEIKRMLNMI